jgi:hypothetical protein
VAPDNVHTGVVLLVNTTNRPESDVAVTETVPADSAVLDGPVKVIVCGAMVTWNVCGTSSAANTEPLPA